MQQNSRVFLILFLGILSAFGPFVVDLYLPALPQLSQFFNSSTSMVQMTLTTGMLGLAVGQLFFGPLSDKYGRRMPLLLAFIVYLLSTVLIVFSPNIETLIALRLVQGFMAAAGVVISRAVVADLYHGQEMTRFFGALMTINTLAPILSIVLGGVLLKWTDWRGLFVFLALLGGAVLFATVRFRESLPVAKRLNVPVAASFAGLLSVMKNRNFMLFVLIEAFATTGMFAYIAASPFIFQSFYGLDSLTFSLIFASNGLALIVGTNIGGRLNNRLAVKLGVFGTLLSAVYLTVNLVTQSSVWLVEAGFLIQLFTLGLMLPALSALAMDAEREQAGSASALLGFLMFVFGAVVSPLVGIGNIFIATSVAIVIGSLLALGCYAAVKHKIS
ncbi:multidrug effflux MFS transporter [Conservatibacter flavescens]|uniref:Bcr/CflA family efflux transporter n=1 Tax=Conservatibacter flavescens TaxID=28161 RepID=A0A2M8S5C5_9PAST|nr:multidrug effflux MFS transporter [Conservatibacter flavescens]PJG86346.1 Bcr/CflA family drug resistance efflux transporter [Conservatibacter flavescens]